MASDRFVIVGGGLAGAKAAETLRAEGFDGDVTLLAGESHRPYERPPLSKGYLLGKTELESAYVHEPQWYVAHSVDLRTGDPAVALDPAAHTVRTARGDELSFSKLLLATGASPRRLPGTDLDGVHYLREIPDSTGLQDALRAGDRRVVVVGAGWIGMEVAAAAREYGNAVTILSPQSAPLETVLGPELGQIFGALHSRHGVELRMSTGVASFLSEGGRVTGVRTDAGEDIGADLVVVGIGAAPNVSLAEEAGLRVDNGIVTDQALRTSHPDVFAAGDVANWLNPLYGQHMRVEHWANALNGGPAAARSMLGQDVVYDRIPYFYTDQFELGMEYTGYAEPGDYDQVVYRGDPDSLEFIAFWLREGTVVAGMNVNVWDVTDPIKELIRAKRPVDIGRLTDPGTPLADLTGG